MLDLAGALTASRRGVAAGRGTGRGLPRRDGLFVPREPWRVTRVTVRVAMRTAVRMVMRMEENADVEGTL